MQSYMQAGKFKAQCLKVMEEVQRTHKSIVITKRNVPVVRLVPLEEKEMSFFGNLKNSVRFLGDVIEPIEEKWDANT